MAKLSDKDIDELVNAEFEKALADGKDWAVDAADHFEKVVRHAYGHWHKHEMEGRALVRTHAEWTDMHLFWHEVMKVQSHNIIDLSE